MRRFGGWALIKNKNLSSIFMIVLVLIAGICAAVGLYFYQVLYKTDHFLPGVHIASIPVEGYSRAEAVDALETWKQEALQTKVTFHKGDFIYQTQLGKLCEVPDLGIMVEETWEKEKKRNLKSKLFNLDGSKTIDYPQKIRYKSEIMSAMVVEWNESIGSVPVNPRLEMDRNKGLIVVPGKIGQVVNQKKTMAGLPQKWGEFTDFKIPIVIEEKYPQLTEADLQEMGELAYFTTWYNPGEVDRSHNLAMAAAAINTQVVSPGQSFSFNKTVGRRTFENGYRDAMVIVGGKFEPGVGGGICQVSSTLYNAVLLAGLDIVERHNHALAVAYVPLGLDATVAYGLQDFKFKNNTDHPIYLQASAGGGRLTVRVYGHLKYKQSIKLTHVIDRVIDFKEIREPLETLNPGEEKIDHKGFPGYVVRSFRTYHVNGQILKQEKLATDYYKPLNKLIYVGPPADEEDTRPGVDPPDLPGMPGNSLSPDITEGNQNNTGEETVLE